MTIDNAIPHYNLGYVIRETNIHPDTLRAWERRYGLPKPQRSEGGHRLYTARDIEIIHWLIQQQKNGLSISKAVALMKKLVADGRDPTTTAAKPIPMVNIKTAEISGLRNAWIEAIRDFDNARSDRILSRAFANYPVKNVLAEVLSKGLVEIGDQWYRGETTIQQEHFASGLAIRRLYTLIVSAPPPTRPGKIIIALPAGEEHEVAPLMLNLLLRYAGWDVIYLGANVPTIQLGSALELTNPELVILSAHLLPTAASLLVTASFINTHNIPLAFGGAIFNRLPQIRERIPGFFIGKDIEEAVQSVNTITLQKLSLPAIQPVSPHVRQTLSAYQTNLADIEASLQHKMRSNDISLSALNCYNKYFGEYISAALSLGDLHYASRDIEWVKHLINHHNLLPTALPAYLAAYHKAVKEVMGASGALISDWLNEEISRLK